MDKIGSFIKKNPVLIIASFVLISLSIFHQDSFFVVILTYGLLLKLLSSEIIKGKLRSNLAIFIWTSVVIMIGLMFYVNHYMPHGPSYPTGEYVCDHDDRGTCREEYIEDMSKLNIPDWAKFVRSSAGWCLIFALVIAGGVASDKKNT